MKTYIEVEETEKLENAATCLRDRLLIRLLRRLGCRISEALGLTVEDIDFSQGTVTIEHLKYRIRFVCPACGAKLGKHHSFCPGCGRKVEKTVLEEGQHRRMRTLPIDSETLEMLHEYIDRGGPVTQNGKHFIFGINRHRAWQIVKECADKAGLPKLSNPDTGRVHNVSPHRLRDCFAVMAVQQDDFTDGIRMLQEWLGHANIGTTMRYRKVAGKELKDWYERIWPRKEGGNG